MNLSNENDSKNPLERDNDIASVSKNSYLGRWAELPSSTLEQIYTYLDRSDQLNVSLVCKNWSHEYGSPGVWKNFTFNLFKKNPEFDVWPEVKFAQRYGSMFRHIEIIGRQKLREREIIKAFQQMQLFFEQITLSKCQLLSIKFKNMYGYNRYLNVSEYSNFLQSVSNFMSSQHNLQTVEFLNCYYNEANGMTFPSLICESIANTLKVLVLKGKDGNGKIGNELILEYGILLQNLMNLKILRTDYTVNFEKTLCSFCDEIDFPNQMTKNLSLFELHCEDSELASVNGIPEETWRHLQNICPNLKVQFKLAYSSPVKNHFSFYLVKYIPLVDLEFRVEKALGFEGMAIGDLLRHLIDCKLTKCLVRLSIIWTPIENVNIISTDLNAFLQTCEKLEKLQITTTCPVPGLEQLCESIRKSSISSIQVRKVFFEEAV